MTSSKRMFDYEELQKLLDDNHFLITAAELQGLLMGFYSAGLSLIDLTWKQQLLKQLSVKEPMPEVIEAVIVNLNDSLKEMICSNIFGLELLLPDDESTTIARGEALGYWCQGFLLGYMQVTDKKEETDEDVEDSLSDLEEISNIDLDTIGNTEEDEKLLFEITEHIKVAAQLIHNVNGESPITADETLH